MGIRAQIESAIEQVFDAFDDLPVACTFKEFTGGTYNTSTGLATDTTSNVTTEAFVFDFNAEDIARDPEIQAKDKKIIVKAIGLNQPQLDDKLTVAGVDYLVKKLRVPVDGLWIIRAQPIT